ncbi:MAG: amidase [Gammaproteobacteria bacterium]|nr:amidase [Gammaproteobacteria bacterium]
MDTNDYIDQDATGLAELLRAGQVSAAQVRAAAIAQLERLNPRLNAVIEVFAEPDAGADADGPFAGVPFLIKDVGLHAAGRRQEMGSRLAAGLTMPHDTHLMARFRAAGLVTLGRTTTPEFGWNVSAESVATGATRNPWDPARMAGGSSGGSAAAVAAGIVPVAHANDGGGSIRIPAGCCGLVGLKPTRGRIPNGPDSADPLLGFGVEFVVSRTVRDSAILLDTVQGADTGASYIIAPPRRPYAREIMAPPRRLRIAWTGRPWSGVPVAPDVLAALAATVRLCAELGHELVEDSPAVDWESFDRATQVIYPSCMAEWIEAVAAATGRPIGPDTLQSCTLAVYEHGRAQSARDLLGALGRTNAICRGVGAFFERYDLLLTPTSALAPQPIGTYDQNAPGLDARAWHERIFSYAPFTALFNMTGQPAISLPLARCEDGLPLGMQFVAPFGDEATLLALAATLEQARPWPRLAPLARS